MCKSHIQNLLEIPWIKEERNKIIEMTLQFEEIKQENLPYFFNCIFSKMSPKEKQQFLFDIKAYLYTTKDRIISESEIYIESKKNSQDISIYRKETADVRKLLKS